MRTRIFRFEADAESGLPAARSHRGDVAATGALERDDLLTMEEVGQFPVEQRQRQSRDLPGGAPTSRDGRSRRRTRNRSGQPRPLTGGSRGLGSWGGRTRACRGAITSFSRPCILQTVSLSGRLAASKGDRRQFDAQVAKRDFSG
jgi:hypothetical protein